MSTSDKKNYALVTQKMRLRLRRTSSAPHYSLPKPYRRKDAPEEGTPWKRKLVFYVASGLVIGVLISQIADLADSRRRDSELPIVAAATPEDMAATAAVFPAAGTDPAPAAAQAPPSPAPYEALHEPAPAPVVEPEEVALANDVPVLSPGVAAVPAQPAPALAGGAGEPSAGPAPDSGKAPDSDKSALAASVARKPKKAARPPPGEAIPPDPDVVLVSAILLLGPTILGQPEQGDAACMAAAPKDEGCAELHGMAP